MSKTLQPNKPHLIMDEQFDEQSILNDELVTTYLQNDKHFFIRNPQLLTSLSFTDSKRGTVSLVERQQQIQRQKINNLEDEITQLMAVANYNEKLFAVYNDLYLNLLDCDSLPASLDCIEQTTTQLLNLAGCKIYFCENNTISTVIEPSMHPMIVKSDCQDLLVKRLGNNNFYFGRLQQTEKEQLFADIDVGSVALIKLSNKQDCLGFIAINSIDPEHFQPSMNVLLLTQFRDIVGKLLSKQIHKYS